MKFSMTFLHNCVRACVRACACVCMIHEKALHAQRATVWRGFWAGRVIGPYFFENDAGNAVTVNGVHYRNMITEFLWPQLDGMDMEGMWFQQDGATCHTACETMELLREKFPGRVLTQWWSELATDVVRFEAVRLLSLRVFEILCLCQQTTNNSWVQGGDSTCQWRN